MNNAINLVDYLLKLSDIGREPIRDVNKFERVLWLHEVPDNLSDYCYTVAHGIESGHDDDVWIYVKKCNEPRVPFVPVECREWVVHELLKNPDAVPLLKEMITRAETKKNTVTGEEFREINVFALSDFPEVTSAWHSYLENEWQSWSEDYRKFRRILKVYSELFDIHQELLKLGEEYELVMGFGLLNWRTPSNQVVRRHIITAKVSLEFEAHRGVFFVKPANDETIVSIEFDMIDVQNQPINLREMEKEAKEHIGESLWNRAAMEPVLTSFVNKLPSHGRGEIYWETLEPEVSKADETPRVEFAPALILRKRSVKGLQNILRKMRDSVANDIDNIPKAFLDLCEIEDESKISGDPGEPRGVVSPDEDIYFPLPSNEEQGHIIKTMMRSRGAIVQGPPGTGKSHTIANLICHLLATGHRILVTAKTPRALQVLHGKLPKEMQPLCISTIATGPEENNALRSSVEGIQKHIQRGGTERNSEKISHLEKKICAAREEKARTENRLRSIRESETFQHEVAEGRYIGTAAAIARMLAADAESFGWFDDAIPPNAAFPLTEREVTTLRTIIQRLKPGNELLLVKKLPDEGKLPRPEKLQVLFDQEKRLKAVVDANSTILSGEPGRLLKSANIEHVRNLKDVLMEFLAANGSVYNRLLPWIRKAVQDVIADIDLPWRERLMHSQERLAQIRELSRTVQDLSVTIPSDMDLQWLQDGGNSLRAHFVKGGSLGFGPLKPKIIREYKDIIQKVRVNGRQCSTVETLDRLAEYLTVAINLENIWNYWSDHLQKTDAPFPLQVALLDEQNEALEEVISLHGKRHRVLTAVQQIAGLQAPRFDDDSAIRTLSHICDFILTWNMYQDLEKRLTAGKDLFAVFTESQTYHPVCARLYDAYVRRDVRLYVETMALIDELRTEAAFAREHQRLLSELAPVAPGYVRKLRSDDTKISFAEHLPQLHAAWDWSRANRWIQDMLSADVESLGCYLTQLEDDIFDDIAQLASLKSWEACLKRMSVQHQQHLTAWQQAMGDLGMGTGPNAHIYRRNAQYHLEKSRDAVPAWIMPLHRVYDTIVPAPGMFDTIIVDEASQCGVEALPLFFLAKNILIVGDDKQISPEAVAQQQEPIQQLMRAFLKDFHHPDAFNLTRSLYDHAQRLFVNNRIILREHFRCMPEIIGFSNHLCYQNAPLIPLKQYLPERLEPLKKVQVVSGYREGDNQKAINRPEAEALVRQLVICCGDDRYDGKTFGVIVLQGEAQANIIQQLLLKELGAEKIEKRKIICGNAYSFQGDERDIIFLSMVADANNVRALSGRSYERSFNVAASRAKEQMWLFHSVTINDLSPKCLRYKLLVHFSSGMVPPPPININDLELRAMRDNRILVRPPKPFDSWFEVDVALAIARRGYHFIPQHEIANKRIDLVVQGKTAQLAVECDGDAWHGPEQYDKDMYRQRMLERCGWRFVRIRECLFYAAKDSAMQPLWDRLEELGITPMEPDNTDDQPLDDIQNIVVPDTSDSPEVVMHYQADHEENGEEMEDVENDVGNTQEVSFRTGGIVPDNIHHALTIKKEEIEEIIIEILEARPKNSCIKDKMASYILQAWKIRSWGAPKQKFEQHVAKILASMARKKYIEIYTSKNIRIKLGLRRYERQRILL
jgi:very-short-patch-repair endonuclease